MRIDVNAFLGRYPFRASPGGSPASLARAMERIGIDQAWISNLSAIFWRDPTAGNQILYEVEQREPRFRAVPAVDPELANWRDVVGEAAERKVPCVRADPTFYGLEPAGSEMRSLATECAERGIPLMLAVRLEDGRQRHPNDTAPDLPPWAVRSLVRSDPNIRLIITHADKDFIEQVHFGSTPAEAERILWDICWIWGPPEDHLALLLGTVGKERFTFGTGMPLRLPENSVAKLELLDLSAEERGRIDARNLEEFLRR